MNLFILISIWLVLPAVVFFRAVLSHRRLEKERLHDQILYRFCAVRDAISLHAASGGLDEDSEIFRFFYSQNAKLIHHHRTAGLCFHNFAKGVLGKMIEEKHQQIDVETKRLFRQLKHADQTTRDIASKWLEGASVMMDTATRGTKIQRAIWRARNRLKRTRADFYRWLGRQHFVSHEKRAAANFFSLLANVLRTPETSGASAHVFA
jgi:hypothetical protein